MGELPWVIDWQLVTDRNHAVHSVPIDHQRGAVPASTKAYQAYPDIISPQTFQVSASSFTKKAKKDKTF